MQTVRRIWQTSPAILISLALFLAFSNSSCASETRVSADRNAQTTFSPAADVRIVHVETENGDINYVAGDDSIISINARIVVRGHSLETCQKLADQVSIDVHQSEDEILIETKKTRKLGFSYSIGYTIHAPRRLGVKAETVNGEVSVEDAEGDISIESVNGTVNAVSTKGKIESSTTNGSILLTNVVSPSIEASTVNGRIACSCKKRAPGSMDLSTVNGSIDLMLPQQADAKLNAETVNGGVRIDDGSGNVRTKTRGSLEVNLGAGSGKYDISSINGAISISIASAD
jgi:DUF4097 and DUF4098 domain-containing protein YvlB